MSSSSNNSFSTSIDRAIASVYRKINPPPKTRYRAPIPATKTYTLTAFRDGGLGFGSTDTRFTDTDIINAPNHDGTYSCMVTYDSSNPILVYNRKEFKQEKEKEKKKETNIDSYRFYIFNEPFYTSSTHTHSLNTLKKNYGLTITNDCYSKSEIEQGTLRVLESSAHPTQHNHTLLTVEPVDYDRKYTHKLANIFAAKKGFQFGISVYGEFLSGFSGGYSTRIGLQESVKDKVKQVSLFSIGLFIPGIIAGHVESKTISPILSGFLASGILAFVSTEGSPLTTSETELSEFGLGIGLGVCASLAAGVVGSVMAYNIHNGYTPPFCSKQTINTFKLENHKKAMYYSTQ